VAIFRPAHHRQARIIFANEDPAQSHKPFDWPAPLEGPRARRKGNDEIMGPDPFGRTHSAGERAIFLVEPDLQAIIRDARSQESQDVQVPLHFMFCAAVVYNVGQQAVEPRIELLFALEDVFRITDTPRGSAEVGKIRCVVVIDVPSGQ
jgi:hypothetical protein